MAQRLHVGADDVAAVAAGSTTTGAMLSRGVHCITEATAGFPAAQWCLTLTTSKRTRRRLLLWLVAAVAKYDICTARAFALCQVSQANGSAPAVTAELLLCCDESRHCNNRTILLFARTFELRGHCVVKQRRDGVPYQDDGQPLAGRTTAQANTTTASGR